MIAIISDIHGNLDALEAVMEDIAGQQQVDQIWCLGDVIGYGPDPVPCLELVQKKCQVVLKGNHEKGLLESPLDFNPKAREALEWTRDQLEVKVIGRERSHALWNYIDGFALETVLEGWHLVHGSPRDPTNEYIMPADALDRAKLGSIFDALKGKASFGGHTHVPGVFAQGQGFQHQKQIDESGIDLPDLPCHVNIGSVGQPRDADPRASYVLLEGNRVIFRRVPYDVRSTMKKILANPALDDFLARRLAKGQ